MLLQFIKRDPAWKNAPWFAATAAIASLFYSPRHEGSLIAAMAGPIYLVLFTRALPHQRVTFFEAALPVSGRDLWLARFLSLMSLVWLPAAAAATVLLLTGNGARTVPGILVIASLLSLSTVVVISARVRQFAAPVWLTMACPVMATCALIPALSMFNASTVVAACAAAAAGVGASAWKKIPQAFQSAPLEASEVRTKRGKSAASMPWWPVIRSLFPWQVAIFIPISLVWSTSGDWIFAPMYLMMAYAQVRVTTRWTLGLPIPRRAVLAASVLPLLLALAGGVEYGMLSGMVQKGQELIRQGDPDHFRPRGAIDVFVNRAFWRRAPNGQVPVIQAPWGETCQPPASRILGIAFYNPYSVGEKNSLNFQDWQFARATTDIYGRPMAARELARAKRSDLHPITVSRRMQILSVSANLAMALFWVWLIELFSWHRIGRLSTPVRNTLTYSTVLAPILLILCIDTLVGNGMGSISKAALEGGLLFLSSRMPADGSVVATLCLTALAAMFWIVCRQAAAAESYGPLQQHKNIFDGARG